MLAAIVLAAGAVTAPTTMSPAMLPGFAILEDDYPIEALRDGRQGKVGFAVTVGANGLVRGCEIITSADPDLDAQTCNLVKSRMKFTAARDDHGNTVDGRFVSIINWQITAVGTPLIDATAIVTMDFALDGTVERCTTNHDGASVSAPVAACNGFVGDLLPVMLGGAPTGFSSASIIMTMRVAGPVAPSGKSYGIARTTMSVDWTIDAAGAIRDCLVVANEISGDKTVDVCSFFRKFVHAPYATGDTPRKLGMGFYAFAQPRIDDGRPHP